jgi:predicted component of type VI protein secretion system
MHVIMAKYQDPNTGAEVHKPRYYVLREDGDLEAEEAEALALSQRLGRAASLAYMTAQYPNARRGADHNTWQEKGLEALQQLDDEATAMIEYSVERSEVYDGPDEDVTPVFQAMLTAFAQHSASPPQSPQEAVFRLIRDGQG